MNKPRGRPPKAKPQPTIEDRAAEELAKLTAPKPEPQMTVQSEIHRLLGLMSDINLGRDGG